jgi:hypothetical protein
LGTAASLSSASLAFLALGFAPLDSAALLDLGVDVAPLVALGVALDVSLILGFFTESDRCGVYQGLATNHPR